MQYPVKMGIKFKQKLSKNKQKKWKCKIKREGVIKQIPFINFMKHNN